MLRSAQHDARRLPPPPIMGCTPSWMGCLERSRPNSRAVGASEVEEDALEVFGGADVAAIPAAGFTEGPDAELVEHSGFERRAGVGVGDGGRSGDAGDFVIPQPRAEGV